MKAFYPLIMLGSKMFRSNTTMKSNHQMITPPLSFYSLSALTNSGKLFDFAGLQGKYVLIANTASQCGFTGQYAQLQELQEAYADKLVVLGFPANDFGRQEPGADDEIASFCQLNFGVSFPLMKKASVLGNQKQPVYQWLTNAAQNGWNNEEPNWNFCKYLVDQNGHLLGFYASAVSPLDEEITGHLDKQPIT
jgi:glutathione peroxidase